MDQENIVRVALNNWRKSHAAMEQALAKFQNPDINADHELTDDILRIVDTERRAFDVYVESLRKLRS